VPQSFIEYVKMLLEHAGKHIEQAKKFLDESDFDALDFAAAVAINDLIRAREVVNTQLKYSKQGGQK
jgi:HEPN domain-containing protein